MRQWLRIIRSRRSLDGSKLALFVFLKKEGEREGKGKVQELGLPKIKKKGALRLGCREEKEGWDVLESVGWGGGVQGIKSVFGSVLLSTVSRATLWCSEEPFLSCFLGWCLTWRERRQRALHWGQRDGRSEDRSQGGIVGKSQRDSGSVWYLWGKLSLSLGFLL